MAVLQVAPEAGQFASGVEFGDGVQARGKVLGWGALAGLVELAVTNPADPGGGWVHVGYEGYLIWERWTRRDVGSDPETVIAAVTGMLTGDAGWVVHL